MHLGNRLSTNKAKRAHSRDGGVNSARKPFSVENNRLSPNTGHFAGTHSGCRRKPQLVRAAKPKAGEIVLFDPI
jgi:hypothetical protein